MSARRGVGETPTVTQEAQRIAGIHYASIVSPIRIPKELTEEIMFALRMAYMDGRVDGVRAATLSSN